MRATLFKIKTRTMQSSWGSGVINDGNFTLVSRGNITEIFNENISTETTTSYTNFSGILRTESVFESQLMIPLHITIFILSILGNTLVLFTLVRNKRMRTVTNVYLLNLVSRYSIILNL